MGGVASDRCVACHVLANIGVLTTSGARIERPSEQGGGSSFHQELSEQNCSACHSDHGEVTERRFSHALLRPAARGDCVTCHAAPTNDLHRDLTMNCDQCHTTEAWSPATFDHTTLSAATLEACESCHAAPTNDLHRDLPVNCDQCHTPEGWSPATFDHTTLPAATLAACATCHETPDDSFHLQVGTDCAQCHSPQRWTPSTFDHARFFLLDRDHNTTCETCHTHNDFTAYTCFGCHEHTPSNIRGEHEEEGIRNFQDCVRCHRSADEEHGEGREGRRGEREHDDD
jgi:hypothetical protein